jgi:hypothetical protein
MNNEKYGGKRAVMDCVEFRDALHELDRPGTSGAASLDSAMEHAESCGDCGVLLVEEESLGFALRKVAQESARMPGAGRVEAELLKEFRQARPETVAVIPARRNMRWGMAALGIAAAILLVLGTVIYERNLTHTPVGSTTNITASAGHPEANTGLDTKTVTTPEAVADNPGANITDVPSSANSASSTAVPGTNRASTAGDAEPVEYATAFVPLPYADDPSALEGGSVVRVTLARSALESYGLAADGMGAGDRVTADMIVSEDGRPQAIRLVAQDD